MPLVPLAWLAEHVDVTGSAEDVAAALVKVGLEEEAIHGGDITGPLVVGRVLDITVEPQKSGKMIRWTHVDVGEHNPTGEPGRGIICGADNFAEGDLVVVALPGSVLPGGFEISARKTYGHISDGMICSERELGIGDDHTGIIVLERLGYDPATLTLGQDAIPLLGLTEQVVEVNVTPDRGYCFAIRGIAREYGHSTGAQFRDPALIETPVATDDGFPVVLADDAPINGVAGCSRYVARIVRGVDNTKPAPAWMQRRLNQAGMRPISLVVDVTNYVMLDLGQPLHAFDLAELHAPITVRRARPNERLVTLDGVDRALDPEDLLITDGPDAERVMVIAGVFGGEEIEVTPETTDILIEAANFDSISIARTARRHRLPSESSRRFERGVDSELQAVAAQRAVELLVEYGGGVADAAVTDVRIVPEPVVIHTTTSFPTQVIGVDYSPEVVVGVLRDIGCEVEVAGDELTVRPPSWRPDLTSAIDLVEEVARLRGYDEIGSELPDAPAGRGLTADQRRHRAVSRTLAEAGLVEVLTYPFVSIGMYDEFGVGAEDERRQLVKLSNPIAADAPYLRSELLTSVLTSARRNVGRGRTDLHLYELGQVFRGPQGSAPLPPVAIRPPEAVLAEIEAAMPAQPWYVAGFLSGQFEASGPWGPGRVADAADAVALAVRVAGVVGVPAQSRNVEYPPFHPGRCAAICADDGTVLGHAGELHPRALAAFELPARSVAFELNLDVLFSKASDLPKPASPVSGFPLAKEDLAFVVADTVPASDVLAAVREGAGELLEDARVFDVFTGPQVGEGKKSVAIALRMRAPDRTLTADEVAAVRFAAVAMAKERVGAVLR
jgi:phenylalanyl-tRNA synthetase beta chain